MRNGGWLSVSLCVCDGESTLVNEMELSGTFWVYQRGIVPTGMFVCRHLRGKEGFERGESDRNTVHHCI